MQAGNDQMPFGGYIGSNKNRVMRKIETMRILPDGLNIQIKLFYLLTVIDQFQSSSWVGWG